MNGHRKRPWLSLRETLGALLGAMTLSLCLQSMAQAQVKVKEFDSWPAGSSPKEIGKRVAERFVASAHPNFGRSEPPKHITYPEVCTWYGALTFAQLSGDQDLSSRIVKRYDKLTDEESQMIPKPENVDSTVFAAVPLELYIENHQQKYLDLGQSLADKQWEDPTPDGLSKQTRFWIDDMFMLTIVQVQAYRATGDAKYIDRVALEMTTYLDKLQQPNGLFYHAPDVPFFWGRGDGWVAAGMTEVLRSIPKDHPRRARIMEGYQKMMQSLLKYQGKNGVWRQLIDHPESWEETSSTGMFTYAMVTGVKNGWLDKKKYAKAARKAWLGLVPYIDANGDIGNVCQGTNKLNDYNYYMTRERFRGDFHGQAPLLWTASAFLR